MRKIPLMEIEVGDDVLEAMQIVFGKDEYKVTIRPPEVFSQSQFEF